MTIYKAPHEEQFFILEHLLGLDHFKSMPRYADLSDDLIESVLTETAKLFENIWHPLNQKADMSGGCKLTADGVKVPEDFHAAHKAYVDGGWIALAMDPAYGGQGLPETLAFSMLEQAVSANTSLCGFYGCKSAATTILTHGNAEQKATYVENLATGQWGGTMCLTEPHCGSDLGLLRTRAEPQGNGTYKITGQKIFITGGDHDLTDNIIHLVLARLPDAPPGVKGISLFIVPKIMADGSRNSLSCTAVEKKMGLTASATCAMEFEAAIGFLLGAEHRGLNAMFTMINESRLSVSMQAYALAEIATQNAVAYAHDRLQGRYIGGARDEGAVADPIIVHPDVQRLLILNRAYIEAARAAIYWSVMQMDISRHHPDDETRRAAEDILSFMTPVLKGYLTEEGFEATSRALQCFGGHGYIRDTGVEQFLRDTRITMIYEGTTGIQALDLLGRKMKFYPAFLKYLKDFTDGSDFPDDLRAYRDALKSAIEVMEQARAIVMALASDNPHAYAGVSVYFLRIVALLTMGYFWGLMVQAAMQSKDSRFGEDFRARKKLTADAYFALVMPEIHALHHKIKAGANSFPDLRSVFA
ncbi:acyl-CoA dehydrogenase [Govanella unica]|uniref:3-methylmercaptopropionyl-CoA dehydrogenase n=1 Tax=Govanella unica TaxID=2975056 RepID=A0A9X3TY38_9PROT|nr:acyl-CoA dehydrogenase [Govania unica]MDA5193844.1 acyl-CoA dehydrogenase [Govania unica]